MFRLPVVEPYMLVTGLFSEDAMHHHQMSTVVLSPCGREATAFGQRDGKVEVLRYAVDIKVFCKKKSYICYASYL